jgi:hypothetical protein
VEGYDVQRSSDSTGFSTIATVSTDAYTDPGNTSGVVYYRIRQRNVNGSFFYSNIVAVEGSGAVTATLTVAPNPTRGPATLRFNSDRRASIPISLYDLTGRPLWRSAYAANPGVNTVSLDALRGLPDGIYILQVATGEGVPISVRITLIH